MSEGSSDREIPAVRRTRLAGSCDYCRKRKIKCDSATKGDSVACSNCEMNGTACLHENRPRPKGNDQLQRRVKELEHALREERKKNQAYVHAAESAHATNIIPNPGSSTSSPEGSHSTASATGQTTDEDPTDDEFHEMVNTFDRFSLSRHGKYFGPSSNVHYLCKLVHHTPQIPVIDPLGHSWPMHPWESGTVLKPPELDFPPDDLLALLVDIYFRRAAIVPILHRASFQRDLDAGLHLVDNSFGFVVLGVCAIASRECDDPRVLLDSEVAAAEARAAEHTDTFDEPSICPGVGAGLSRHSAGWKYFSQIMKLPRALFSSPTIHDVQFCCLYTYYGMGTSAPQANWTMIGAGVRYALELGMNRRQYGDKLTLEDEIEKRAFWAIVFMDRHTALYFGRPAAIRDEDIDVDLPIDCDDEHLEAYFDGGTTPTLTKIAAFIHHLRLLPIQAYVSNTIYGSRKNKRAGGYKGESTVAAIDSMLNAWFGSIPEHLRWDPQKLTDSPEISYLTMVLYILYYDIQITVHRPFLLKTSSPQALPSRAICLNAARSVGRLLETMKRQARMPFFIGDMVAYGAGLVLVTSIRTRRMAGVSISSSDRDILDLWRITWVLHQSLVDFNICGRMVHTLKYLANLPPETALPCDMMREYVAGAPPFTIPPSGYVPAQSAPRMDMTVLEPTHFGLAPMSYGNPAVDTPTRHDLVPPAPTSSNLSTDTQHARETTLGDLGTTVNEWEQPQPVDVDMSIFQEGEMDEWMRNAVDTLPLATEQWMSVLPDFGMGDMFSESLAEYGVPFVPMD
ncbi:hypothetical protein CYLTODRAFT_422708 [Cylindrobasidium torrendii FP15055 ss-10]|uniref:Zn(2)-C6 fungal-type domain-containing protein n=1 Tax=Cylindrobasidium torrendii FP15055 ss-10 TaxID=1314674 RepID=A0A0D7BAI2_9AGAR|nr:hypothetical protein CYLTODRAFT_422708 [Cylindrobasidium torrendii FP15055 ss-10]